MNHETLGEPVLLLAPRSSVRRRLGVTLVGPRQPASALVRATLAAQQEASAEGVLWLVLALISAGALVLSTWL